ncbi:MAG: hypothetical protein WA885_05265 [Phormidesmis sp.]
MDWLEKTAQLSQIAAVISVIFAALSIRSNTQLSQRQWNVDTFTTYSERHKAVVSNFPDDAFYHRLDPDKLPPRSPKLTRAVLDYLFVICDVHYLSYQKYLDNSIWQVWRDDLERTLSCPLITREWPDLKPQFESFTAFTQFVENIQKKSDQKKES